VARARAEAVDRAVVELFGPDLPGVALSAVGGHGSGMLAPGSDIDLLVVWREGFEAEAAGRFERLLYHLWDLDLRVGHALRTTEECEAEARRDIRTLTAMLSIRLLSGLPLLAEEVRRRSIAVLREPSSLEALRQARDERAANAGSIADSQEPDLRDSLGGLRDAQLWDWLEVRSQETRSDVATRELRAVSSSILRSVSEALWRVRIALHRVSGAPSNVLSSDHQEAAARELELPAEPGWEPRDVLMRDVHVFGGQIASMIEARLESDEWPPTRLSAAQVADAKDIPEVLGHGDESVTDLRLLNAAGGLGELIPEWRDVQGRPQRDPYHQHPVDAHLLHTVEEAARLLAEPDEPFAAEAVAQVDDVTALLLGALLHDIGKVGSGSHVKAGVEVTGRVLDRMAVTGTTRDGVLFLVGEHLLLSDTATRRDLDDEALILDVASRIGTPERLAMLYLLTVADALATGPAASTPWRLGLIRDLVSKVSRVLEGAGVASPPADQEHLELAHPRPAATEVRTRVQPGSIVGSHELVVAALDRPGLLAMIAGSLTLSGLSVFQAQAFTTDDGVAIDTFEVGPAFREEIGEERWRRFRTLVRHAIEGRMDVRDRVERLRSHYRPVPEDVPMTVRIHSDASEAFTIVEVGAADRMGLLFDLARTFADQGLDVHLAKVATYGPRVVDAFYVTDREWRKLDEAAAASLESALRESGSLGRNEPLNQ
jgi:[protein-PII] uridylyltransferase